MSIEASKMLDDVKKRIESTIKTNSYNSNTKLSHLSVTPQVVIGNPAQVIIDIVGFS